MAKKAKAKVVTKKGSVKVDPTKVVAEAKKLQKGKVAKSEAYETLRKKFRVPRVTPFFKKVGYTYSARA